MHYQSEEAIHEILPGAGSTVETLLQQEAIDFGEAHVMTPNQRSLGSPSIRSAGVDGQHAEGSEKIASGPSTHESRSLHVRQGFPQSQVFAPGAWFQRARFRLGMQ